MTPTQATAAKQPITASQHLNPKSDIEISQSATKRLIVDVARDKAYSAVAFRRPRRRPRPY